MMQQDALSLGKAAEHLVCANLLLAGRAAYLSDQGLPYDVVVDCDGRLIRVQVKGAQRARDIAGKRGTTRSMGYTWHVRRRGKGGVGERLSEKHCDMVALVAMDINRIAYRPVSHVGQTCQLLAPDAPDRTGSRMRRSWARRVSDFPFEAALEVILASPA